MPDENNDSQIRMWMEITREQGNRADSWGIEALRSLLLLNTAGLAGAITAFQVSWIPRAITPSACYMVGILSGFIAILFGWLLHRTAAKRYQSNAKVFIQTKNTRDLFSVNERVLMGFHWTSILLGLGSLCGFMWGSFSLVRLINL